MSNENQENKQNNSSNNNQEPVNENNTTNSQPKLDFWNFTNTNDPTEIKKSAFPKDKLVSTKEMTFYFEKLYNRISKYKDSKCFDYIQGYYDFNLNVYNSKNEFDVKRNYDYSQLCLKLFNSCMVKEKEGLL
jgi:hypothetical protein